MLIRALAVVGLLAVAWIVWKEGGAVPPPTVAAEAQEMLLPPEAGVLAGLPESAVGRRAALPPPSEDPRSEPATPPAPPQPVGEVLGILMDREGAVVPHAVVLLRRGVGVAEERCSTLTDADGMFHFGEVAAGAWQAGVLYTPPRGQASAAALQEVEVVEDRRTWVDLWVPGTRKIRGRILLDAEGLPPEMVFEVEARPLARPDQVAADVVAAADGAEIFEPTPERAELERRVLAEFFEENPGAAAPLPAQISEWADALAAELDAARVAEGAPFTLAGLEPSRYVLRIYLDVAREIWAEFEADLREGDAELGLLRLGLEDFSARGDG